MSDTSLYLLFGTICTMFGYVGCIFFNYAIDIKKALGQGKLLYDPNNKPVENKDIDVCIRKTKNIMYGYMYIGLGLLICPLIVFIGTFSPILSFFYTLLIGICLRIAATTFYEMTRRQLKKYKLLTIYDKNDKPVRIK